VRINLNGFPDVIHKRMIFGCKALFTAAKGLFLLAIFDISRGARMSSDDGGATHDGLG